MPPSPKLQLYPVIAPPASLELLALKLTAAAGCADPAAIANEAEAGPPPLRDGSLLLCKPFALAGAAKLRNKASPTRKGG